MRQSLGITLFSGGELPQQRPLSGGRIERLNLATSVQYGKRGVKMNDGRVRRAREQGPQRRGARRTSTESDHKLGAGEKLLQHGNLCGTERLLSVFREDLRHGLAAALLHRIVKIGERPT